MNELVPKGILPLSAYAAWVMCFVAAQTHAASFDCASAKTVVEKQICGDILLSVLDDALSAGYTQALAASDSPQTIESQQKDWLSERDRCEERKMPGLIGICVEDVSRKRLRELGALPGGSGITPSFDCAKALTAVEKLICDDAVLATIDKGMAVTYAKALKSFEAPEALKVQQREWLQWRARCERQETEKFIAQCVSGLYAQRLYELDSLLKKPFPCPALPLHKHESEKAECLKNWLAKHPLEPYWPGDMPGDVKFCAVAYQAFATASPDIQYIDPVLSTDDPEHLGLERYRRCHNREAEEITGLGYDYFGLDKRAHGFRLYRLDLDGNPENGLEEYLYEEESRSSMVNGFSQYVRVDFERCEIIDRLQVVPQRPIRTPNQPYGLNAMIKYQERVYFYEQEDIGRLTIYPFERTVARFDHRAPCIWKALRHSTRPTSKEE